MRGGGFDSERHLSRRAVLYQESRSCRAMWAAVVLLAMNESAREIRKLTKNGAKVRAQREIDRFSLWIKSKDGREVLGFAGIDASRRAIDSVIDAVVSGRAIWQDRLS